MAETIVVAMSGGVDSSVAAAILKERGCNVIGIGLQLVDEETSNVRLNSCCGIRDMDDARRAAQQLSIPFYILNFKQVFRGAVIEYFIQSYLKGETPNPCIACNEIVKFEALWRICKGLRASLLATGHYARVVFDEQKKRYILMKGVDKAKDQSYFLYSLSQYQLTHACFPLGGMTKEETRTLARSIGLRVHNKRESQDICFVGGGGYGALIQECAGERIKPGPILDENGKVIGMHKGIPFYTVGQRRGIGIPRPERMYVSDIDPENNTITVTQSRDNLKRARVFLEAVNYISVACPDRPMKIVAKTRYGKPEMPALLLPLAHGKAIVEFLEPQETTAPGQSVVFYCGDSVIGGGIARRSLF